MKPQTINEIESLINLLYLIELRAGSVDEVRTFVKMSEGPMAILLAAANEQNSLEI